MSNYRPFILSLALLCSVGSFQTIRAQEQPLKQEVPTNSLASDPIFLEFDKNKDGLLNLTEFFDARLQTNAYYRQTKQVMPAQREKLQYEFQKRNKDRNWGLSPEEYNRDLEPPPKTNDTSKVLQLIDPRTGRKYFIIPKIRNQDSI